MAKAPSQLELIPLRRQTAAERRAWIRSRLAGLELRQAARVERRRQQRDRRSDRTQKDRQAQARQVTIEEALSRS